MKFCCPSRKASCGVCSSASIAASFVGGTLKKSGLNTLSIIWEVLEAICGSRDCGPGVLKGVLFAEFVPSFMPSAKS